MGQDSGRGMGRPDTNDRDCGLKGLFLRDKLRQAFLDYDMTCPRKNDWREDSH